MRIPQISICLMAGIIFLTVASMSWLTNAAAAVGSNGKDGLDDADCLTCHSEQKPEIALPDADGKLKPLPAINKAKIESGVHSELTCVTCHKEITDNKAPHKKSAVPKPNCVTCHEKLWASVKAQGLDVAKERLGIVVRNAASYKESFHAKSAGKSGVKAYCDDCHDTHYFNVPPRGTSKRTDWHLTIPNVCGAKCHSDVLDEYKTSVHGNEVLVKHNLKAAVCTDCHTSHEITKTSQDSFKVAITHRCGNCHQKNYSSYTDTLHGQINVLGYAFTAKCYDCHGSHDILRVDDPESSVSPKNRLETCQQCHDGKKMPKAAKGFMSFGPHANDHDFKRYPQMWIASKFMHGLFLFVFGYFWVHSLLWWHREYKDRRCGVGHQHIQTDELLDGKVMQVRRFGLVWRIAHLLFAVSVMMLVLTGMTVFYSYTTVAPVIMSALGGPKVAGLIHRISATIMLSIFFLHLVGVSVNIYRNRKTFSWFGPDSLVPNWKDLKDACSMFVWFVGKGPRPVFDRWTYWEKFDYWAVFWGMMVIGGSGMLLAFPHVTARLFPGWIFNVIMVVHGEEAFLAAVFLFTVHFFNNHFRPDKIPPPDIVMFTGTQSLEEFRRDHALQYQRLVQTGQLEKYLVEVPSKPMTLGSRILGIVLLLCGLGLLAIVAIGFFTGNTPHSDVLTVF
jgi:cytochrome b subunit of formate dehydrogenase